MIRIIIGAFLVLLYFLVLIAPPRDAKDAENRAQFPIPGAVFLVLPGLAIGLWGYRSRKRSKSQRVAVPAPPPEPLSPHVEAVRATTGGWKANLVLVVGKTTFEDPVFRQVEGRLVRTVAALPRVPIEPGAAIETLHTDTLPGETRKALEPVVWSLQRRYKTRGDNWHADFYSPAGYSFMVVYLE
jgi:hypothetical protein